MCDANYTFFPDGENGVLYYDDAASKYETCRSRTDGIRITMLLGIAALVVLAGLAVTRHQTATVFGYNVTALLRKHLSAGSFLKQLVAYTQVPPRLRER